MKTKHYTTGSRSLDKLLGGGFESGTLTQVYGAPGTGKTNICLQTAIVNAKAGTQVLYIDTDNCSEERYMQILSGHKPLLPTTAITFIQPKTLQEQGEVIDTLERSQKHPNTKVDLVLIDTLTFLYRLALDDKKHPKAELGKQALTLLELARKYNVAVVVTNQIYKDLKAANTLLRPLGGHILEHLSKVIVELKKTEKGHGERVATLKKCHATWPDTGCTFNLVREGIRS